MEVMHWKRNGSDGYCSICHECYVPLEQGITPCEPRAGPEVCSGALASIIIKARHYSRTSHWYGRESWKKNFLSNEPVLHEGVGVVFVMKVCQNAWNTNIKGIFYHNIPSFYEKSPNFRGKNYEFFLTRFESDFSLVTFFNYFFYYLDRFWKIVTI
jgi:hypothetical protein